MVSVSLLTPPPFSNQIVSTVVTPLRFYEIKQKHSLSIIVEEKVGYLKMIRNALS